jgi:hypothetical protein
MRTLSSDWTFFYKFIFPVLWIGGFASMTLAMFITPDSFTGDGDIREFRMGFLVMTILGSVALYWCCMRLKKVTLKEDALLISNFRREVKISLRNIERVSGTVLMHPELVWLHFRRPTGFGLKVVFMGKSRFSFGLTRHPVVKELEQLIGTANL